MVACLEAGYRVGHRRIQRDGEAAHEGISAMEAATFAMLGLLLGFAFSGAPGRFDTRRGLIVQEANAIGTAYLRIDSLERPRSSGPAEAGHYVHAFMPRSRDQKTRD
jgi:hypothetical protein